MLQKKHFLSVVFGICCAVICILSGCSATVPGLDPMVSKPQVQTPYTDALRDLNTLLEAYLPSNYPDKHFVIKKAYDSTGLSGTGEIPVDITAMVRDAVAQVHHKVRYLETYDAEDNTNIMVQALLDKAGVHQGQIQKPAIRRAPDFTIQGTISQFDRNLESTSDKARAMVAFGGGGARTDINASAEKASNISRLALSFSVYDRSGVSLPGKFGSSMEVQYAKNGFDIGFAIYGNGLGYGTQATAMHGRHLAIQMMTEFSVVQIIGRALEVPYWRVGASKNAKETNIFTPDEIVLKNFRDSYEGMYRSGNLIGYMQSQCIANGDGSVSPTGQLDGPTQASFERFAAKYGVSNRSFPNFELFRALEENRVLNRSTAAAAWAAWDTFLAYKGGAAPAVASPPAQPQQKTKTSPVSTNSGGKPARSATSSHPVRSTRPAVVPSSSRTRPAVSRPAVSRPARSSGSAAPDPTRALQDLL